LPALFFLLVRVLARLSRRLFLWELENAFAAGKLRAKASPRSAAPGIRRVAHVERIVNCRGERSRSACAPGGTMLAKQTDRLFADLTGSEPGNPDGMKVDIAGNVYTGAQAGSGFSIRRAKGLAASFTATPATNNVGFGGDDWKTLYFVSRTVLGAANAKIPGVRCLRRNDRDCGSALKRIRTKLPAGDITRSRTLIAVPLRHDHGTVRHRARSRGACPCSCGYSRPSS
jgi:SMP-30/Gluconolactonase/LRE-like region